MRLLLIAAALAAYLYYVETRQKVARLEIHTDALLREAFRPRRDDLLALVRAEREEEANQYGSDRGMYR